MNSDKRPGMGVVDSSRAGWRKSSRSSVNANCVEINSTHSSLVRIRDSKDDGTGPTITVPRPQWAMFLNQVAASAAP